MLASGPVALAQALSAARPSGDLGLERQDRAPVGYTALAALGYSIVVPYELELSLGLEGITRLKGEFPDIS